MKKILVVDDSKTILGAIKTKFLKYPDIEVIYAETYKETMQVLRGNHEDIGVALLDINLPDAPNGQVISLANAHNIPAIVLTGTLNQAIRETIEQKEICGYILKDKSSSIDLAINSALTILENSNKTILIVDDSKLQRKELSTILQNNNLYLYESSLFIAVYMGNTKC